MQKNNNDSNGTGGGQTIRQWREARRAGDDHGGGPGPEVHTSRPAAPADWAWGEALQRRAEALAWRLARRMEASDRKCIHKGELDTSLRDGMDAAAAAAIAHLSAHGYPVDAPETETVRQWRLTLGGLSRVMWRALVDEVERDTLGESDDMDTVPAPTHEHERFLRLWARSRERARALRTPERLAARIATMSAGRRGRAASAADRLQHAALLMLSGMGADAAASAAGYKAGGKARPQDRLRQAVSRLTGARVLSARARGEAIWLGD